ncbi:MAG: hypothetical protein ACE5FV_06405 [Woeseia sp.]
MPRSIFVFLLACTFAAIPANGRSEPYPLFDSQQTLEIILEFPIRELLKRARNRPTVDGRLHYTDEDGSEVVIDIDLTSRGRSRLEHCSFPPLSVTPNPAHADDTLFAGQNKLKIVTHCRNGTTYLEYLHQEYGIYRAYNILSDYSFRVRLLKVTYRDSENKRRDDTRPAFFVESHEEMARRLGMTIVETRSIRPDQFDQAQINIYELFQYMIANTDWAITKGPGTEHCCHNGKVLAKPGTQRGWIVVPYDFDQAGLINTSYALPADGLGIRNVRQRLYRGRCQHNDELERTIELFNDRREAVDAEIAPQSISDRTRRTARKYVAGFYSTINDSARVRKKIIRVCRGATDGQ